MPEGIYIVLDPTLQALDPVFEMYNNGAVEILAVLDSAGKTPCNGMKGNSINVIPFKELACSLGRYWDSRVDGGSGRVLRGEVMLFWLFCAAEASP